MALPIADGQDKANKKNNNKTNKLASRATLFINGRYKLKSKVVCDIPPCMCVEGSDSKIMEQLE